MPSFVYSTCTLEQLDDVDGYAPSVRPVRVGRPTAVTIVQQADRASDKPTLVELIEQQKPAVRSDLTVIVPTARAVERPAKASSARSWRQKLRWSRSSGVTHDSIALCFIVAVLLFCALCVDQFAITQVALDTSAAHTATILNPSNAPTTNTLGAFTFCRSGTYSLTQQPDAATPAYTFQPDRHCSRVGAGCTADGWSLGLMLGRGDGASCGLFDVFRAYLIVAFFCAVAAVGLGSAYVRGRPSPSPTFAVAVVFVMLAITVTTLIAGCIIQSMLPPSATHSHSFWLVISALLLSLPASALFSWSEYKRLYGSAGSPPDAIHSDVPPVRLTEGDDELDEKWERQRHEASPATFTYTLDDDHGALLAIEEGAPQPVASATTDHREPHPPISSPPPFAYKRAKAVAFQLATHTATHTAHSGSPQQQQPQPVGALVDVLEDGEAELSVSRIEMAQAEWDEEEEEARMEGAEPAWCVVRQRAEHGAAVEGEEKAQVACK